MMRVAVGACASEGFGRATRSARLAGDGKLTGSRASVSSGWDRSGGSVCCAPPRSKVVPAYSVTAAAANPAPN